MCLECQSDLNHGLIQHIDEIEKRLSTQVDKNSSPRRGESTGPDK